MSDKLDDTIKLLLEEGRKRGFLTFGEMSRLLEDQFLPPDKMDQVFLALEDHGVEVLDDADARADGVVMDEDDADPKSAKPRSAETEDAPPETLCARGVMPE